MRNAALGIVALATAGWISAGLTATAGPKTLRPDGPLATLADVERAIQGCWEWPAEGDIKSGMELTVRLSFKRNGEIFGARITHQTQNVTPEERDVYYKALMEAIGRCSPLPLSPSLGQAIAGRPFFFRLEDHRKQRKASLHG